MCCFFRAWNCKKKLDEVACVQTRLVYRNRIDLNGKLKIHSQFTIQLSSILVNQLSLHAGYDEDAFPLFSSHACSIERRHHSNYSNRSYFAREMSSYVAMFLSFLSFQFVLSGLVRIF